VWVLSRLCWSILVGIIIQDHLHQENQTLSYSSGFSIHSKRDWWNSGAKKVFCWLFAEETLVLWWEKPYFPNFSSLILAKSLLYAGLNSCSALWFHQSHLQCMWNGINKLMSLKTRLLASFPKCSENWSSEKVRMLLFVRLQYLHFFTTWIFLTFWKWSKRTCLKI